MLRRTTSLCWSTWGTRAWAARRWTGSWGGRQWMWEMRVWDELGGWGRTASGGREQQVVRLCVEDKGVLRGNEKRMTVMLACATLDNDCRVGGGGEEWVELVTDEAWSSTRTGGEGVQPGGGGLWAIAGTAAYGGRGRLIRMVTPGGWHRGVWDAQLYLSS